MLDALAASNRRGTRAWALVERECANGSDLEIQDYQSSDLTGSTCYRKQCYMFVSFAVHMYGILIFFESNGLLQYGIHCGYIGWIAHESYDTIICIFT
jgi:hypothetical protein